MKPHDAEQIIEAIGLGGHEWCPDDIRDTYEMEALETIAGMTTEYRHEVQSIDDGTWHPLTEWAEGEPDRRPWNVTPTRIVRRYVTTEEEA